MIFLAVAEVLRIVYTISTRKGLESEIVLWMAITIWEVCNMSKRKRIVIIAGIIVILLAIPAYFFFPITPLTSLTMADIEEIHILAVPPDQEVILQQKEIEQMVNLLQEITVYQPGYISGSVAGQFQKYTITKTDGTRIEIADSGNIAVSINGVSYRAGYSSVEAISDFVNEILYRQ